MANSIGDRYTCSDTSCGCEIEVQRPSSKLEGEAKSEVRVRRPISSDLMVPPSQVNEPRVGSSLLEGAGERGSDYGSPKFDEEGRGPFRTEENLEGVVEDAGKSSTSRGGTFTLTCFCGHPMILSGARSTSARAGGTS
jgi:hypothetical protein